MKRAALLASAALPLAACATVPPTAYHAPLSEWHYVCTVERADAMGSLRFQGSIEQDGSDPSYSMQWSTPDRRPAARVFFRWRGARWYEPGQEMDVDVTVYGHWRGAQNVRVEFWRTPDRGIGDATFAGNSYPRRDYATATGRLSEFRLFAAGIPTLYATVTDRNTNQLAQAPIETALLDAPGAAMAAARSELEAMMADYRNRCTLTEPALIVVT